MAARTGLPQRGPAAILRAMAAPDAHVLVVDDERDITALVAYHLAKAG